jgi:hypothetical protein
VKAPSREKKKVTSTEEKIEGVGRLAIRL